MNPNKFPFTCRHRPDPRYQRVSKAAQENTRQKRWRVVFAAAACAFLVTAALTLWLWGQGEEIGSSPLNGTFRLDGQTVYRFAQDGTGLLKMEPGSYPFSYRVQGDRVWFDYEDPSLTDCAYRFTLRQDGLTLQGEEGTIGGSYHLTREEP